MARLHARVVLHYSILRKASGWQISVIERLRHPWPPVGYGTALSGRDRHWTERDAGYVAVAFGRASGAF